MPGSNQPPEAKCASLCLAQASHQRLKCLVQASHQRPSVLAHTKSKPATRGQVCRDMPGLSHPPEVSVPVHA